MTKTFTENDLVSYLYGEASPETTKAIQLRAMEDLDLEIRISEWLEVKQALDHFEVQVPCHVTDKILSKAGCLDRMSV